MRLSARTVLPLALLLALAVLAPTARPQPPAGKAATAQVLLPLGRTAYQTNEWVDVSVLRQADQALTAGDLALTVSGDDGSKLAFTFPVRAVPVRGKGARATEHLHLNGHLLRPGRYTLDVAVDGAKAKALIEVFPHLRKSDFKLINWGRATGKAQLVQGEDSLGFNLFYGHYGQETDEANFLRAGVDFMSNCTMSGAHQMDIRLECDWSDPYVTRGGTVRVVRRALQDRTRGNVLGVHFYDEPGLTWLKHPVTGENTPHMIPAQVRSFRAAFNEDPLSYHLVDPKNPEHVRRWARWARWKLAFMDAAWKEAQFGVSFVRPDFLSVTQSQYGWSAFTDGYYFNVARSLPVASGHGGYDDYGPGFFNPSFTLEMARARDHGKPCWYLPTWYGNTPDDRFRLEQYLSFQTNIQGMMSPPDLEPATNAKGRQGIVESNRLMQRLGPVFHTMPVTKPPVAMLYSLSQAIHTQTKDMQANYAHGMSQGINLPLTYLAGKLIQQQFLPVVEEDLLDGTLADDHKAVVLTSLDHLDKKVIDALEDFASRGGKVLLTGDCKVKIKGAVDLKVVPRMPDQEMIDKLSKAKKYNELGPYTTTSKWFAGATPLAKAIKAELDKEGIKPIFHSDVPTVVATRQAAGDVEYLFAVNATHDGSAEKNAVAPAAATLTLEKDGRPVYDALVGGPAPFEAKGKALTGKFRFGPGQMRVFARTARLIGGVKAGTPVVVRELVKEKEPIRVEVSATLLDDKGRPLSGSVPLHVRVTDPLGVTRFELYRATKLGQWSMALPLAANDPAGRWTVRVRELLANSEDVVSFPYAPPARAAALAGATRRAVAFGNDLDNVFRFARLHRDVTIVKGTSPYHAAAAERLSKILSPWGVRCSVVDVASAGKARPLSAEEAPTWIGLVPGRAKAGAGNPPNVAGFAVRGHAILLGSAEDNAIIKYLLENKFLPYAPKAGVLPGVGWGMIAWQRDGVGHGQESVALIAHDEEGLSEAVGTFYEAVAGLECLTKRALPSTGAVAPAKAAPGRVPAAAVAWTVNLPDRVVALKATAEGLKALTHDGSLTTLSAAGKVTGSKALAGKEVERQRQELAPAKDAAADKAAKAQDRPDRMRKLAASQGGKVAVAYWGGTLRVVGAGGRVQSEQLLAQDVTALAWLDGKVVAGLANGQVVALRADR
jgi:hypothetical protein